MSAMDRYFHGDYRAARAWLLLRVFPCMVALDAWMLMIGHAGRYGVDGFNVAQFRWLDSIAPLPNAAMYIGVLLLSGLSALCLALGVTHFLLRASLFALYTFSWSMSMLDSYQHHYFVSSVLLCVMFFPSVRASELHPVEAKKKRAKEQEAVDEAESRGTLYAIVCGVALAAYALIDSAEHPWLWFLACVGTLVGATAVYRGRRGKPALMANAFGFNLLGAIVGILYTYTAIAKMDAAWCAGATIQRISSAATVFAPLVEWMGRLGMPAERFWSLFATSVIPLELLVACGYLLSVRQDAAARPWLSRACTLTFVLAMTLHVGAEAMKLEIGWFSYYMMLLGCVFLLPGETVDKLAGVLTWPARALDRWLDFGQQSPKEQALQTLAIAAGVALALGVIGHMLDLPGAQTACAIAAAGVLASAAFAAVRKLAAVRALLAVGAAAALMLLAIASSEVRWDFYRYLGGDLSRRNQPEAALAAYERGERYAPKGESRMNKIRELRQQLGK